AGGGGGGGGDGEVPPDGYQSAGSPVTRARAAPGSVAAHDPPRRGGAVDPGRVRSTRGASCRPGGRHAHGRVPGQRRLPPPARGRAEERDTPRGGALRGDGSSSRARIRGRRGATRPRGGERRASGRRQDSRAGRGHPGRAWTR